MNLQYITNNNPPPAQSVLQYSISPDTVFVSTNTQTLYANLTITVFNPSQNTVACQMFKFGFNVGAQYGDLTTTATGIQSVSDQTTWTISKQATPSPDDPTLYQFSAPASGMANLQLAPQQSLVFHLNGIQINSAVGAGGTPIVITEVTGPSGNPVMVQGQIAISKQQPTLAIQTFTASPPTPINPGNPLTLNWKVTGSSRQQLYNLNTGVLLYDSTTSPPATSYTDSPQRNTTYELIAWAGQLFTVQTANAMVNAPQFIQPDPKATPSSVNPGGQTVLSWNTVHADTVTITAPGFITATVPAAQGQYTINSVTAQTTYILTASAQGITATDTRQVTVQINLPAPSVLSFTTNPILSNPDGSVTLSWETAYTTSADLKQTALVTNTQTDLGPVATNQSAYKAYPKGIIKYLLGVFGQGGQAQATVIAAQQQVIPIGSTQAQARATAVQLLAKQNIASTGGGGLACDLIYDGANIWVANWRSAFKIQASSGSVIGAYPASEPSPIFTPWALACIPNSGSIFVLSQNDCYIIKLNTSDGSVQGAYTASSFTQPVNFPSGYAITVDANYIWVAYVLSINPQPGDPTVPLQYNGAYVSKLSLSDGSIQGEYQIATAAVQLIPSGIASDGTNVWVASRSSLTKLRASDGTVQGTYLQQSYPQWVVFDGTNIWASCGDGTVKQLDNNGNVLKSLLAATGIQPTMGQPIITPNVVCVSTGVYDPNTQTYSQALQLLRTSDGTSLASFTIAPYFASKAFDGTCFWLLARSADSMSVWAIKI